MKVRNIDVLVAIMECADTMLSEMEHDEIMFDGFNTLHKLCSMLSQDFVVMFSKVVNICEAIDNAEEAFLMECDDETLIVGLSSVYAYGSTMSRIYKMLAAPAFTEEFIPVTV